VAVSAILKWRQSADSFATATLRMEFTNDDDENPNKIFSYHPTLGMVHTSDSIGFIRRMPHRQDCRGYTPRSCNMYVPNPGVASAVRSGTPCVVWNVYNPFFYTLPEAMDILEQGSRLGCVLAPLLGVVLDTGRKYPRLVYREEFVGFVLNGDPYVYDGTNDVVKDYIYKSTGKIPKVK